MKSLDNNRRIHGTDSSANSRYCPNDSAMSKNQTIDIRVNPNSASPHNGVLGSTYLWSFMEQGSTKAVAIVIQIILARLLFPEDFGVLAILLVVTQVADAIAQSGLGLALIQKEDTDDVSYDTGFWLSMLMALVIYLVIIVCAPLFANFYGMPELIQYLRVLSLVVFFNSANSIQRSFMQRNLDFKGLFKISLSAVFAGGAVGISGAYLGLGVWALVLQTLVQSTSTCLVMCLVVPWRPRFRFDFNQAKRLYAYGWKICITSILNVLYSGISELVIGRSCSTGELGYYSQGRKYPVAAIGVMSNSISNVLFPAFSRIKDDSIVLKTSLKTSLSLGTWIVAPFSLLCAVIAKPLVTILLTERWLPCVPIFQLTCISNSVLMFQLVNLRAYMAVGRSDLYMRLQVIKVTLGVIVICGTAMATQSILPTAVATCASGIVSVLIVDMAPAKKVLGYGRWEQLKDQIVTYSLAVLSSFISFLPALFISHPILLLVLQTVTFAIVYVTTSRALHIDYLEAILNLISTS